MGHTQQPDHAAALTAGCAFDLEMARRHVAEAEGVLTRQRALLTALAGLGRDTEAAYKTLAVFEEVLNAMRQHLAVEERLVQKPR
ncbi:hypothetical protein [Azohydromonas caseinilytica]|uniref:Hemerythrin HHE cation binding domain-containing protein n=1 Tax=Azohydromonas caseinilytica TaxID=2728836 RepID=A0A848FF68_9BURK|nr:hypothetical protein [Azohydromonas caseinilytica]NML16969.1 hypothetical protein [Azohydromonas caseinilytica]